MRRLRSEFLGLILLCGALSGCVGGEGAQTNVTIDDIPPGLGLIRGLVIDPELQTVAGAIVTLDGGEAQTTGIDGAFEFRAAIGSHVVQAQAPGFTGAQTTVDVIEAEAVQVQMVIERLPSDTPYTQVLTFTGFEVCGFFLGVTGSTGEQMVNGPLGSPVGVPCTFGQPKTSYLANVTDSWRYLVMEMDWATRDTMWFLATHQAGVCGTDGDSVCWGQDVGNSPLRIEGAPGSVEHAQEYSLDGKKTFPVGSFDLVADSVYTGMLREEVNGTLGPQCATAIAAVLAPLGQSWNPRLGCGFGYGYSVGYKINYYVSIFHYGAPDEAGLYTARPDA